MAEVMRDERVRAERLLAAQAKAEQLFAALGERGVIAAGVREDAASQAIGRLAADLFGPDDAFGADRYWRRRVVRAGPNTVLPVHDRPLREPPSAGPASRARPRPRRRERIISEDDIVVCDIARFVADLESDFGRTFVVGHDPVKERLRDALPRIFDVGRCHFERHPDITGEQLHASIRGLAAQGGWVLGGTHAGHLVGPGPAGIESFVAPGNDRPMREPDRAGRPRHWILRIHLVDAGRQIGGFHEELLDLHR